MAVSPGGRPADASPLGTGDLWHTPGAHLPSYVRMVANALVGAGHDRSKAIQMAIGVLRNWASGQGNVRPQVRAAAAKAVAEWESMKALARATPNR